MSDKMKCQIEESTNGIENYPICRNCGRRVSDTKDHLQIDHRRAYGLSYFCYEYNPHNYIYYDDRIFEYIE